MKNSTSKGLVSFLLIVIAFTTNINAQQIGVQGNGAFISDNDSTPNTADFTDFDTSTSRVFRISNTQNNGNTTLTVSSITLSNPTDFTISSPLTDNTITKNQAPQPFTISFIGSGSGTFTSTVTIASNASNDGGDNVWTYTIRIVVQPEIDITGNGISIADNDTTPNVADDTNYGNVGTGSTVSHTFTILNTANPSTTLNLTGVPLVAISGDTEFSVTAQPSSSSISGGNSVTFTVQYAPITAGTHTAVVSISNDDPDGGENPYNFTISGNGVVPSPELDLFDDANNSIADGSADSPSLANSTSFGTTDTLNPIGQVFTIENNGTSTLNIASVVSSNPDFTITSAPASSVNIGNSTTFTVLFTPSSSGVISSTITITNDDIDENPYTFTVQGEGIAPPPSYTAYYETFDSGASGWTVITSTNDTWLLTDSFPTASEMGEGFFWRNSNYNNYLSNTNIVIESPAYSFVGLQNLKLSIDIKYNTENNIDGMRILYSVNGGAFTTLGSSGVGTNWYGGSVSALGSDGWSNDGHSASPSFNHSQFGQSSITLSDAIFSNATSVRFRVQFSSDGSTNQDGVAFDNFLIEADPIIALSDASVAPANITSNLRLWLKGNEGISVADGSPLTLWEDRAYATTLDKEDAYTSTVLAPTYRDNANRNINFNPVADFDHNNTEYMNGKGGYFSQDYFVVFRSDDEIAPNTGSFSPGREFPIGGRYADDSFHEDPTGLGLGSTSARFSNEILSHCISSFPNSSGAAPNDTSYGRSYSTSSETYRNHPLVVNVKSNTSRTATEIYKNGKRVDNETGIAGGGADLNFNEFNNLQYLVGMGRSGINGRTTSQMNGMVAEIISYTSPNSALNQRKIESYLAVKYGITLQDAASSISDHRLNDVDYIDSQGSVIWDTSTNSGFNYDIAGIGRDDDSNLNQKQSRSQNDEVDGVGPISGFLSIGLTELYDTNNNNISTNSTTLSNRQFLMWGNNNGDLTGTSMTTIVDMSVDIGDPSLETEVTFEAIPRIWKVVEVNGDIPSVQVSIPTSTVRTATPPDGRYLMFISDTGVFDPTADYRVMTEVGGNLYTDYDFDGTKYITFGWAPERVYTRSVYFNGSTDYIDMEDAVDLNSSEFTISAWINRESGSNNTSILSKRNEPFTEGYDFKISSSGRLNVIWENGGSTQQLSSTQPIPEDEWHHVAIIYGSGTATLYIDGVRDSSFSRTAPIPTTQSFYIGAANKNTPTAFFRGNIDEVRIWDVALTEDQLRFVMNQEIENNSSFVGGSYFISRGITPTKNDIGTVPWSSLAAYYPMTRYTYTNTKDESGNGNQGALRHLRTVDRQTAPLPYISNNNGSWDTNNTWLNGSLQYAPGSVSVMDNTQTIDWNIVETSHNITMDNSSLPSGKSNNRLLLGLLVDNNELTVTGNNATHTGNGVTVTHYLSIGNGQPNAKIDLEGESQLIQTIDSDLDVQSEGTLERDQQGTADTFTYNYWSSPVGNGSSVTNNNSYTVSDVMYNDNGANPIVFTSSGYNGSNTSPAVTIADYWIWKFASQASGDYSSWQHVRQSGNLLAGEGFTMKGPGSGSILTDQNYTFLGKPNNGDIGFSGTNDLDLAVNNDYLVGNPYPSAIDAVQFINDNGSTITGTLYFWEHWGGGSHVLSEYQGGYATLNLSGGLPASSYGTNDPDVGTGGTPVKRPGRYIPVSQGFFVSADAGGKINFNNGQRIYRIEDGTYDGESGSQSVFVRQSSPSDSDYDVTTNSVSGSDNRLKLRLGLNSVNTIRRQLLLTIDENATLDIDWGYDGKINETQIDDMFWMIEGEKYLIQGSNEANEDTVYPLGIKVETDGMNTITIDALQNAPEDLTVYIHNKITDAYHNLSEGDFNFYLDAGEYLDTYEITFSAEDSALGVEDNELNLVDVYYDNTSKNIVLLNPGLLEVKHMEMLNILGQSITTIDNIPQSNNSEYEVKNLSTGTYIIKIHTVSGSVSKKVLVK